MATHAKKRFVVDPSEARYTGQQRRAFGSILHEVEFFDGDRRGEKIWVRMGPMRLPRIGSCLRTKVTLEEVGPPPESLLDVVRRQTAEEEEHERRALDPDDDYPPVRRLQHAAGRGGRRAQPPVGTTYTRVFRGQEVRCQVVAEDASNGETLLGFRVGPKTFRSLTAAAESLTGYPVSGPVFWGLR